MVISEDLVAFVNQFLLLLIPFTAYIKILQACQGDAHTLFLICNHTLVIFNWCRMLFLLKGKYKGRQYLQNQTLSQSQLLAAAWHFFPPLRSICRWEWLLHYRLSCAKQVGSCSRAGARGSDYFVQLHVACCVGWGSGGEGLCSVQGCQSMTLQCWYFPCW